MGRYLIPGARSVFEAVDHLGPARETMAWDAVEGGVECSDPTLGDSEIAALYAGFQPAAPDEESYRPPIHPAIRLHAGHLRDYRDAVRAGQPVTAAQTQHVIADIIDWIRLAEDRL